MIWHERRERMLVVLKGNRLTSEQLCARFGVCRSTMRYMLKALVEEGLVVSVGKGTDTKYYLAPKEAPSCLP